MKDKANIALHQKNIEICKRQIASEYKDLGVHLEIGDYSWCKSNMANIIGHIDSINISMAVLDCMGWIKED